MDLTVQQLRCFVAVADELSFTRAAARLSLSPSTVSEQVSGLERRLGLVLLLRTSRKVSCTEAGSRLLPQARKAVDGIDAIASWAAGADAHPRVTIGVMSPSASFRALLHDASAKRPDVDWRIRQLDFANPLAALRRRQLDCAFVADLVPPPPVGDIRSFPVWQERLVLAVQDSHRLAAGSGATMADLSAETLICGPDGLNNHQWFATIWSLIPQEPRVLPTAHNLEGAIEMSAAGIGVTVVTESAMEMFHRPGLAYVPLRDAPAATMRLHVRSGDPSRALSEFVESARALHPSLDHRR